METNGVFTPKMVDCPVCGTTVEQRGEPGDREFRCPNPDCEMTSYFVAIASDEDV